MINYFVSKEQLSKERENNRFDSNLCESYCARYKQPSNNEIVVFLSHKHDEITVHGTMIILDGIFLLIDAFCGTKKR